jgi:hypothetical protein
VLWLEAEPRSMAVDAAVLPGDGPVEKVARIELQSRLGTLDIERAPGDRFDDAGDERGVRTQATNRPVVVVSLPVRELRVVLVNPFADRVWRREVERRSRNWRQLASGYQAGIHRCVAVPSRQPS